MSRNRLYHHPDIYDHGATERWFLDAVRENVAFHRAKNALYKRILDSRSFSLRELKSMEDLHKIPPIPTLFFKSHTFWTGNEPRLAVRATSSGTGGARSQIGLDWNATLLGAWMGAGIGKAHGLFSPLPANYLILGYAPSKENQTAISKTQRASMLYAPKAHVTYALAYHDGQYRLDIRGLKQALDRYERQKLPLRIIGFPAYLYFLLKELEREGKKYRFRNESMVLLGGGWKQFYRERPGKEVLYRLLEERFGIREENCREFFGAVEHPSLYCDCRRHQFHVPVYSRVIVRDVDTLEPVGYGEAGIMNFITPIADSMPLVSILTDDLGILHPPGSCPCGNPAPYFEILGRAGLGEIKTCAAGAAGYLARSQQGRGGVYEIGTESAGRRWRL